MNNDAWKAAVSPPASGAETEAIAPVPPPEPAPRGKVASKAAKAAKAAEKAVKAADKATAKTAAAATATAVGEVCDTAPASPGSPATSTTTVREGNTTVGSVSVVVPDSLGEPAAASSAAIVGVDGAITAPWDEANGMAEGAEGAEEPLSESLRLEPDLELEATTVESLKADLGLPTITTGGENASMGFEMNEAGEGEVVPSDEPASEGVDSVVGNSGRADDLGFEMIDKAEALGAAPAVDVGAAPTGVDGANGKVARKVWPWAWGRS